MVFHFVSKMFSQSASQGLFSHFASFSNSSLQGNLLLQMKGYHKNVSLSEALHICIMFLWWLKMQRNPVQWLITSCLYAMAIHAKCIINLTSDPNVFAIFLRTSGATLGTLSQYSPNNQRMLALAIGTWQKNPMWLFNTTNERQKTPIQTV